MNDKATPPPPAKDDKTGSTPRQKSSPPPGASRFENYAATQAAGDGIQGDADGTHMADRK